MRLVFAGMEKSMRIEPGVPTVLQIENPALFARVCRALQSNEGRYAAEPYTVWDDDGEEMRPDGWSLFIESPLSLPWNDRLLMGEVVKRFEWEMLADDEVRSEIEALHARLSSQLLSLGLDMHAGFCFDLEWDLRRYMRTFGFDVARAQHDSFLDSLMEFLSLVLDARCEKALIFINLKTFLTKNELQRFYEHAFFCKSQVLMLENKRDTISFENERKHTVDLQFLEY